MDRDTTDDGKERRIHVGERADGRSMWLPVERILTGRGFLTGKSGAGKSNTASVIVEELLECGYAVLIVDTDGEYYGLKEEYELLHAGADEECDVQVGVEHAEKLATLALEENVPVILDVSGFLDGDEADELLRETARHLFAKEKKLKRPFLLVVEEIHEYVPEGAGLGETGEMLIKVGKRGRKHGLGIVGISQRPADVKKDFITQANWLVWHRLTWENDTKVVRRIVGSEYGNAVSDLEAGEAFVQFDWTEADVERLQFKRKRTFDAGATPGLDDFERPDLKSVSEGLMDDLSEITEQQRRERDRIEELEAKLERRDERIVQLEAKLDRAREVSTAAEELAEAVAEGLPSDYQARLAGGGDDEAVERLQSRVAELEARVEEVAMALSADDTVAAKLPEFEAGDDGSAEEGPAADAETAGDAGKTGGSASADDRPDILEDYASIGSYLAAAREARDLPPEPPVDGGSTAATDGDAATNGGPPDDATTATDDATPATDDAPGPTGTDPLADIADAGSGPDEGFPDLAGDDDPVGDEWPDVAATAEASNSPDPAGDDPATTGPGATSPGEPEGDDPDRTGTADGDPAGDATGGDPAPDDSLGADPSEVDRALDDLRAELDAVDDGPGSDAPGDPGPTTPVPDDDAAFVDADAVGSGDAGAGGGDGDDPAPPDEGVDPERVADLIREPAVAVKLRAALRESRCNEERAGAILARVTEEGPVPVEAAADAADADTEVAASFLSELRVRDLVVAESGHRYAVDVDAMERIVEAADDRAHLGELRKQWEVDGDLGRVP